MLLLSCRWRSRRQNQRKPQTHRLPHLVVNLGLVLSVMALVDLATLAGLAVVSLTLIIGLLVLAVGLVVRMVVMVVLVNLVVDMVVLVVTGERRPLVTLVALDRMLEVMAWGMVEVTLAVMDMVRMALVVLPSVVVMKLDLVVAMGLVEAMVLLDITVIGEAMVVVLLVDIIRMQGRKELELNFSF